ncbi:hypothetical protein RP20_CCG011187 [Aedes albopictus]|nr:hypothetical protein RP20_CCG011187 [Aedes albopictus]
MEDENIIKKIREFLVVSDNKLQMGAVFVVRNLMEKTGRQQVLRESGILENLEQLLHMTPRDSQFYEDLSYVQAGLVTWWARERRNQRIMCFVAIAFRFVFTKFRFV